MIWLVAVHPNSLRNLRPCPKGEVRNPKGINGATKDRERREMLWALCQAYRNAPPELQQQASEMLARGNHTGMLDRFQDLPEILQADTLDVNDVGSVRIMESNADEPYLALEGVLGVGAIGL